MLTLTADEQTSIEDQVRSARFFWSRDRLSAGVIARKERELRDQLRRSFAAKKRAAMYGGAGGGR